MLLFDITFAYPAAHRSTYGALALAFLGLSSALPTLGTALIAGALADRHDRGRLMRAVNLLAIVAVVGLVADLLLAPATAVGLPIPNGFYLPVWVLLLFPLWAMVTVSSTLFRPAFNTSVPKVVPPAELGRGNGLIYALAAIAAAIGTVVVGAILTLAPSVDALVVPLALLVATQVALLRVDVDLSVVRRASPRSVWAEARAGFAYLVRRVELLEMTVAALLVNFLSAVALVELALYVATWLGLSQGIWYGAVIAIATVGGATGFLVVGRVRFEPHAGRIMILLTLGMGLSLLALGMVRTVWLALPIVFVYGMMPGMITTVFLSTVQATVPDEMMGRVFSADEVGSYSLVPAGQYAGGLLTLAVGVQGTYLLAGAAIAVLGVGMLLGFGALRRLGYAPEGVGEDLIPAGAKA